MERRKRIKLQEVVDKEKFVLVRKELKKQIVHSFQQILDFDAQKSTLFENEKNLETL